MKRLYYNALKDHFANSSQALFLSGPRQVGKTTIAQQYLSVAEHGLYLNWDNIEHRKTILAGPSSVAQELGLDRLYKSPPVICFDEIHKYKDWKGFLKGFIDTYKDRVQTLVTGSARLDVYSKSGDSLMGRYFLYQVHPLSVAELIEPSFPHALTRKPVKLLPEQFEALLHFGGFPDPFLRAETRFYNRWQKLRQKQLFQEDIRDLTTIHEIALMETLAEFLKNQTGQLVNFTNLSQKVRVSDQTIRRWISVFESLYYCFTITPWSANVSRSLVKEPKIYLWDWSQIQNVGQRAENFIASHLLKAVHFWNDSGIGHFNLHFLRTKEQREVDFLIVRDQKPWLLVEVKSSSSNSISPHLHYFKSHLNAPHALQVTMDMAYVERDCFALTDVTIVPASTFLSQLV